MPIDLTEIDLEDLRPYVPDGYKENYKMWDGDHWQDGAGWESILPDPKETSQKQLQDEKKRIEDAFTSRNVVREVVQRHLDGVLGYLPTIEWSDASDDEGEDEDVSDTVLLVSEAMPSEYNVGELLRKAGRHPLLGASGYLRVYPTQRAYGEDGALRSDLSFMEAVDHLRIKACPPTSTCVKRIDGERIAAYWRTYNDQGDREVEVSYLDEDQNTIIAVIEETKDEAGNTSRTVERSTPLALGGNLHVHEVTREPIVSDQVRQQQHMVNKALTMADTNLDYGGFLERIFLNAQRPVERVERANGDTEFVDAPYQTGPGSTAFIAGVTVEDNEGNEKIASPSVKFRDPVQPSTFEETKEMGYSAILSEVNQRHVLMSGDASASGLSRIVARREFVASLRPSKHTLEEAGRWLNTTQSMFADLLSSTTIDGVRVALSLRLDRGVRTPKEVSQIMTMVEKQQMSLSTALRLIGVDDPVGEVEKIESESVETITRLQERAKIVKSLVAAGASIRAAARVAGFSDEDAALLFEAPVPTTQQ